MCISLHLKHMPPNGAHGLAIARWRALIQVRRVDVMLTLWEHALRLPGAILIGTDFKDARNFGYEIGLQYHFHNRRFANFFTNDGVTAMYFKHGAQASYLYDQYPQLIYPSDIAPAHWSVALTEELPTQTTATLLEASYRQVLAALPRKGQRAIHSAAQPWSFLRFHEVQLEVAGKRIAYRSYSDASDPSIADINARTAAIFYLNRLTVRLDSAQVKALGCEPEEPDQPFGAWVGVNNADSHRWSDLVHAAVDVPKEKWA